MKGPIGQLLLTRRADAAEATLQDFKKIYGDRLYIEVQRHGLRDEEETEDGLIELAYKLDVHLVATNDCYYPSADFYEAHDALLCIAEGRYISEEDRRRVTRQHYFRPAEEMIELFADLPEAIQNTVAIAKRCHYFLTVTEANSAAV